MAYDNTNTGILGKNERKTDEKHPDITGSIDVEGKSYWLDGWRRESKKDGKPFYSMRVRPKDAARTTGNKAPPADFSDLGFGGPAGSDDVPFAPW